MSDMHRSSSYSRSRIPRQKRTIRVYGEGTDSGKYYRCWNCGFICNVERDSLGDRPSTTGYGGIVYVPYGAPADIAAVNVHNNGEIINIITTGSRGYGYLPVVEAGCPLCGTLNWK